MLAEIIDAVLTEETVLFKLARGELTEDKNGVLRDKNGAYDPINTAHHLSLAAYIRNPYIFNLVEMVAIAASPIKTIAINKYITKQRVLSR
ncbi:MAG: hypothetical protein MUF61_00735 [archaeon]|jgi:hypothetical protein|nr:hypothetical protein [archaeon]